MLNHEWRELEELCDRLHTLRHRYARAQRSKNVGLSVGLKAEIATVRRQRELLVRYISARLGSIAAEQAEHRDVAPPPLQVDDALAPALEPPGELTRAPAGELIIGFLDG